MASLPSQHPNLAIHLTDRALTPLISSSSAAVLSSQAQQQQKPPPSNRKSQDHNHRPTATFSTSPSSSTDDESPSPTSKPTARSAAAANNNHNKRRYHSSHHNANNNNNNDTTIAESETPQNIQSLSLTHLTTTALASYDAAKRLDRGAPLRTMVEYACAGPVVLHSYLCPMSLVLSSNTGAGGGGGGGAGSASTPRQRSRRPSVNSLVTTIDGQAGEVVNTNAAAAANKHHPPLLYTDLDAHQPTQPNDAHDQQAQDVADGPNAPPMLITTVVAPAADELRDARRAASRMERIARVFQTEWIAEGGAQRGS